MKFLNRLNLILPAIIRAWLTVVGITLIIRWCAIQSPYLPDFDIEVWNIVLPGLIAIFSCLYFLLIPSKLFRFPNGKTTDVRIIFLLISTGMCAISASYAEQAMVEYTSTDVTIPSSSNIYPEDKIRYYRIQHPIVAGYFGCSSFTSKVVGKNNETILFNSYFIAPMVGDSSKKRLNNWNIWLGYQFHLRISNRLSAEKINEAARQFQQRNLACMDSIDLGYASYYERLPNGNDRSAYIRAIERGIGKISKFRNKQMIILEARFDTIAYHAIHKVYMGFISLLIGLSIVCIILLKATVSLSEHNRQLSGSTSKHDEITDMLLYLIPENNHHSTSVYILICLSFWVISLLMGLNGLYPTNVEMIDTGALTFKGLKDGEYWRILISLIAVGSFVTLLIFIVLLIWMSTTLEKRITIFGYTIIMFLSGIVGCIHEVIFTDSIITIGAGYIMMGLSGCLLSLMIQKRIAGISQNMSGTLSILASFVFAMLLTQNFKGVVISGFIGLVLGFIPDIRKELQPISEVETHKDII